MNKLNHSTVIEALLLAMILAAAFFGLSKHMAGVGTSIWYFKPGGAQNALSWAGWWYAYVALPVFQFLLIRWYLKIVLWAAFLWRVSRMDLRLMATHSDGCAGLSFLGISFFSYWPFLLAHGFLTAGMIANRIFYDGATLVSFKWIILTIVVGLLIFTLGPLCLFSGRLIRAKIEGRLQYGAFAARYMNEFHHKWLSTPRIQQSELIGSADIQSLADMSNSFAVVRAMRIVPFEIKYVLWTALIILAPMAPLLLTMFPLNELLLKAVGIFLG